MSQVTRITLVRHGETEWNVSGRWQGHADAPLTIHGQTQARALGERFRDATFDACYTSDLGRAVHTSKLIADPSAMDFEIDERLRERGLGIMQGFTTAEMLDQCPDVYESFRNNGPDYLIPEGESFRQFNERCVNAIEEFSIRHSGKSILVVTHGGVLGAIFRHVIGLSLDSPRRYALLNCSVNVIEKKDGGWSLLHWGDVSHLPEGESLDDA
ncbi:MAG: histidine phosphatase family protein [Verrucomicrobia bacterium]|nr:histidine phosphatase family protein [Verrucomicrobiota bacterium]MDA0725632.1 histidine phosphatase family protein [Verrucomicrobiota bacterium]MDA1047423.1 histidine phosphatase family protein [Verrucomicrobiota bacterium]